jgi:hypothetical protein
MNSAWMPCRHVVAKQPLRMLAVKIHLFRYYSTAFQGGEWFVY